MFRSALICYRPSCGAVLQKCIVNRSGHSPFFHGGCALLAITSSVSLSVPYLLGNVMDLSLGKETGVAAMLSKMKGEKSDSQIDDSNEPEASTSEAKPNISEKLADVAYIMVAMFVAASGAAFFRLYLMQTAGQMITNRLRTDAFGAMLRQEIAYFDKNKTGELVNRLSNDANIVGHSVSMNVSNGLRGVFAMSGSAAMMLLTSSQLSLVGLSLSPLVAVIAIAYGRYLKKLTVLTNDRLALAAQVAEERLSAVRTVRAFGAEPKEHRRYEKKIMDVLEVVFKECTARAGFFSTASFAGNMMILAILYSGGNMIVDGTLTVGQLTSFLVYAIYLFVSMETVTNFYSEIVRGAAAGKRLFDIVDRRPLIPLTGGTWPKSFNGEVRLDNVNYSFGTLPVLRDFSLRLPAGKVTALVGPSGGGKSTAAGLILRFYDPDSGTVSLGGHDMKTLDPRWLRQNVAIVSQEPTLFSDTLAANIAYGAEEPEKVSIDQIRSAAETAHAIQFIEELPDKFDTVLGERGQSLSGGQRQRVAIARALLCQPNVLLLDEATSALDARSERHVRAALDTLMSTGKQTVLVIAHRLSSVRNASQIAVLDNGTVVELGTFEELMRNKDGAFYKLVSRQAFVG